MFPCGCSVEYTKPVKRKDEIFVTKKKKGRKAGREAYGRALDKADNPEQPNLNL